MTTKKGKFSEFCERVRKWQEKPFDYEFTSNEEQHCVNCGHTFTGNFCPYCSQKAGDGYIGWKSVRQSVMDVWGLGSRSLPNTIWQLLVRPGHLISDYINGKRQVSFPPVKMLFVMAVIYSFFIYWLFPEVLHTPLEVPFDKETLETIPFVVWEKKYFSWFGLFTALLFILPTWLLFQHAPRVPKHSIPEGFFIQVLMGVLIIVLNIVFTFIYGKREAFTVILMLAGDIYYFVAYRQLFGYSVWGTIWRQLFMWISVFFLLFGILFLVRGIVLNVPAFITIPQQRFQTSVAIMLLVCCALTLGVGYALNRKRYHNRAKSAE
jgi:hypothetical protein